MNTEETALESEHIILLVTQDQDILDITAREFAHLGKNLLLAGSAEACRSWTNLIRPNLIILDADLPDVTDCYSTNLMSAPLIMLSSCTDEMGCVEIFELGAEDCVTKPVRPMEYARRIQNVLKRFERTAEELSSPVVPVSLSIDRGDFQINAVLHTVVVRGSAVHLSPDEFKVLFFLASNSERLISAEEISAYVWQESGPVAPNRRAVLHIVVNKIRKAIEPNPLEPVHLTNVYRVGYKFQF